MKLRSDLLNLSLDKIRIKTTPHKNTLSDYRVYLIVFAHRGDFEIPQIHNPTDIDQNKSTPSYKDEE